MKTHKYILKPGCRHQTAGSVKNKVQAQQLRPGEEYEMTERQFYLVRDKFYDPRASDDPREAKEQVVSEIDKAAEKAVAKAIEAEREKHEADSTGDETPETSEDDKTGSNETATDDKTAKSRTRRRSK